MPYFVPVFTCFALMRPLIVFVGYELEGGAAVGCTNETRENEHAKTKAHPAVASDIGCFPTAVRIQHPKQSLGCFGQDERVAFLVSLPKMVLTPRGMWDAVDFVSPIDTLMHEVFF